MWAEGVGLGQERRQDCLALGLDHAAMVCLICGQVGGLVTRFQ